MKVFSCVFSAFAFAALAGLYGAACWLVYGLPAIAVWCGMAAAIPLASFLHECGHMLFGAMCKIKAKPHFKVFGSSFCTLIPEEDANIKARIIAVACGGAAVNFIVLCAVTLSVSFKVAPVWLSFLVPANAYLFILNVIPAQFSSGKTDGLVINGLIDNDNESKVLLAVLTAQAQIFKGKRIEELEESLLLDLPVIREDDPAFISLTELRYEYFSAEGDEEKAALYKSRLEDLQKYL